MVSDHPDKFDDQRHHGSGDIMFLVSHLISQDHAIQGSCDFILGSPSLLVTNLPNLVAMDNMVVEI